MADESDKVWASAIRDKDFGRIADWFTTYFFGTGIAALVAAGVAAGADADTWPHASSLGMRVFALGILVAGAATVSGWLLGLLFGIPRSLARASTQPAPAATTTAPPTSQTLIAATMTSNSTSSRVNTNLEDISDWLTKTIVGVGLTQFYVLPKFLGDLARDANVYGFGWDKHGQLLALCLLLYFAPGGFWLGYVGTRTILTGLFDMFNLVDNNLSERKLMEAAKVEITSDGVAPADSVQKEVDAALRTVPLKDLTSNTQIRAWAGTQARARNFDGARVALQTVLQDDPSNRDVTEQLLNVSSAEMLNALYEEPPNGYKKAIMIGERLVADPKLANDANIHIWLACAYAQEYRDVHLKNSQDGTLRSIKDKVLTEIRAAITLQPSARMRLYSFWQPDPNSPDNDLTVFGKDDAEISALLSPLAAQ